MATAFKLSVVAPDRTVFENDVYSVIVPGIAGYLGLMAGHEAIILALKPGIIEFEDAATQRSFVSVSGGFVEVSGSNVIILAQDALMSKEIDLAAAEASLDEARRTLRGETTSMSKEEAMEEIDRAMVRIRAAKK